MALNNWALPQISRLLPLDDDSLKQIITYSDTLTKPAAAEHLKNLLGDSAQALEFITSFNSRRAPPPSANPSPPNPPPSPDSLEVPRATARPRKKKAPFNNLPPVRQPGDAGNVTGAYIKREEDDYMSGKSKGRKEPPLVNTLALQSRPDALQLPTPIKSTYATPTQDRPSKLPPSAAGSLISDVKTSRSLSPAAKGKTKINVTGGLSMRGQSTVINDLDSAIRTLEIQTNPMLATKQDDSQRKCNCMAQRHALLAAAPNCLNCGKIICAKEGLGPCTFCGSPLLSSDEIHAMVRILKEERGKEKMEANNASHKRAEISKTGRPFSAMSTPATSAPNSDSESEQKLTAAKQHRDRLLKFQADNARRTHIHDEAADFETPDAGTSMWATPQERALQLKRQQKVLREQEWSARPEYEKRKVVVSIDIVGGKAVKRMTQMERPESPATDEEEEDDYPPAPVQQSSDRGGTFARNPLLGALIRPVYNRDDKGKDKPVEKLSTWRRVQDDNDDNEQWILDGGAYGDRIDGRVLGAEEHGRG